MTSFIYINHQWTLIMCIINKVTIIVFYELSTLMVTILHNSHTYLNTDVEHDYTCVNTFLQTPKCN